MAPVPGPQGEGRIFSPIPLLRLLFAPDLIAVVKRLPDGTLEFSPGPGVLERTTGFEPATPTSARRYGAPLGSAGTA